MSITVCRYATSSPVPTNDTLHMICNGHNTTDILQHIIILFCLCEIVLSSNVKLILELEIVVFNLKNCIILFSKDGLN